MDGKTLVVAFVACMGAKAVVSSGVAWTYYVHETCALKDLRNGRIRPSERRYVAADATFVAMVTACLLVIAECAIIGVAFSS